MSDQIEREQQIEEESLTKNSLQIQKAAWIREELEKRRAQEDQLLQQILREQQMLQELDEDMDQNMAHAKEGRTSHPIVDVDFGGITKRVLFDMYCRSMFFATSEAFRPRQLFPYHPSPLLQNQTEY